MKPVKVLIVDDSALMRVIIKDILSTEPSIETEKAKDGAEALQKIISWSPDVVTLDVAMPKMDGLKTLKRIMQIHPTRVLMLSGLDDPKTVFDALKEGAIDFIVKPSSKRSGMEELREELLAKVNMAIHVDLDKINRNGLNGRTQVREADFKVHGKKAVAIGASSGGPPALEHVVRNFPANFAYPIFIVQHLPVGFSTSFAKRLDSASKLKVKEAEHGEVIKGGVIYLAPAGFHMTVDKPKSEVVEIIRLDKQPRINGVRPSVDRMMKSVADVYGKGSVGVILTGMGNDGSEGMKKIKESNGKTIVQDEMSSVVFGMPASTIKLDCVDKVSPLKKIAGDIMKAISNKGDQK